MHHSVPLEGAREGHEGHAGGTTVSQGKYFAAPAVLVSHSRQTVFLGLRVMAQKKVVIENLISDSRTGRQAAHYRLDRDGCH